MRGFQYAYEGDADEGIRKFCERKRAGCAEHSWLVRLLRPILRLAFHRPTRAAMAK